jgi:hypothetical protein
MKSAMKLKKISKTVPQEYILFCLQKMKNAHIRLLRIITSNYKRSTSTLPIQGYQMTTRMQYFERSLSF